MENKNEIMTFNMDFGNVRVITTDEKKYFVGVDIARALGYSNASKAVSTHCKNVTKRTIDAPQKNKNSKNNGKIMYKGLEIEKISKVK